MYEISARSPLPHPRPRPHATKQRGRPLLTTASKKSWEREDASVSSHRESNVVEIKDLSLVLPHTTNYQVARPPEVSPSRPGKGTFYLLPQGEEKQIEKVFCPGEKMSCVGSFPSCRSISFLLSTHCLVPADAWNLLLHYTIATATVS